MRWEAGMQITDCSAYEILQKERIEDVHADGYLLRHKKGGARVMLLANQDENKVFNIIFRTPPADSTGVAHILEHSVFVRIPGISIERPLCRTGERIFEYFSECNDVPG
mgnify:CR=1 FL=1